MGVVKNPYRRLADDLQVERAAARRREVVELERRIAIGGEIVLAREEALTPELAATRIEAIRRRRELANDLVKQCEQLYLANEAGLFVGGIPFTLTDALIALGEAGA